jgi:hypothetical protein
MKVDGSANQVMRRLTLLPWEEGNHACTYRCGSRMLFIEWALAMWVGSGQSKLKRESFFPTKSLSLCCYGRATSLAQGFNQQAEDRPVQMRTIGKIQSMMLANSQRISAAKDHKSDLMHMLWRWGENSSEGVCNTAHQLAIFIHASHRALLYGITYIF